MRDLSQHMNNIRCAVLVVGGWFDAEDLSGPFKTFHAIEKSAAGDAAIAGSWAVGAWRMGGLEWRLSGRRAIRIEDRRIFSRERAIPFL